MDPNFATAHPDAHQLYVGEAPQSYRAVANSIATLLREYNSAKGEAAKTIKDQVFRICAHSNSFVRGEVARGKVEGENKNSNTVIESFDGFAPGEVEGDVAFESFDGLSSSEVQGGMLVNEGFDGQRKEDNGVESFDGFSGSEVQPDISVDEWFDVIKSAATEVMNLQPSQVHAIAMANGENRDLKINPRPAKGPLQDKYLPYLQSSFNKTFNTIIAQDKYSFLDPDELKAVIMLIHADYVDHVLRRDSTLDAVPGSTVTAPPNKDLGRALVKVFSDYTDEKNPPAHLLDVVRRSIVTDTLLDQENFVETITKIKKGKFKPFQLLRYKSTMNEADEPVKFTLINVVYTPTANNTAFKPKPLTFAQMVADPMFSELVEKRQQRDDIDELHIEAAREMLLHPRFEKKSIAMVIELQLYLAHFLERKKRMHAIYKCMRPTSASDLTRDLAKYATNTAMAYVAEEGQLNASAKEKLSRNVRRLGPSSSLGSVDNPNKKLSFEKNRILNRAGPTRMADAIDAIAKYCEAFGVDTLEIIDSGFGAEKAAKLAEGLMQNTSLTTLNLSYNRIGDEGAAKLAEGLTQNTSLTTLNLSYNRIGDEGAAKVMKTLNQNTSLTTLNLSSNASKGAAQIAEALKQNTSLATLDISGNYSMFDYTEVAEIMEALKQNATLITLKLNAVSFEAHRAQPHEYLSWGVKDEREVLEALEASA